MTKEVSECSAVDILSCNKSYVLMHGVKSVPGMQCGKSIKMGPIAFTKAHWVKMMAQGD